MRALILLSLMLCGIHTVSAVTHSLQYFYTGSRGMNEFPGFVAVGMMDGMQIDYYSSATQKNVLKQSWMEGTRDEDRITSIRKGHEAVFSANVDDLMRRFNQTTGVHTFQYAYGCEWDDETGTTGGFRQHGYDGEDFIVYDMKNWRYIGPSPQAFITAAKWNNDPAKLEYKKQYLTQECVEWLKKYVRFGRSTLERTVVPEVSLLQKDSSSPVVTCHVTGFYPSGIMVTWQKNGEELHADVELGETVPNEDGTFQITSHLTVKPEDWKSQKYTCTVEHKSLKQDIVLPVTEENIKRNKDIKTRSFNPEGSSPPTGVIIGGVVGVLLLALVVIGVVVWKKRSSGYGKTNTSDTDSENSGQPAVKA